MTLPDLQWLTGTVVRGDGRGKDLGFPTANLNLNNPKLRPPDGIYACYAQINRNNTLLPAVLHAGPVPTFNKEESTVELHLLNWPYKELYGRTISFACVKHLRDIEKFATIEKLRAAMQQDCENALLSLK